ncbi:integral membrane protein [Sodiomyces alkalinus F11]|uniref:Integral membrane protein n=1 Tax=Sodiomyces alkalinus (strain CBS 110278 / VKM F-3762 / F11) TaxID=1314773 RepID=A0A3N2PWJ3_SODAK|nr:integral membrane protein [Sodiomyces alkalinus F11]ROT38864.1 integral membrane protein [Sodiomyces alkalinus F11]
MASRTAFAFLVAMMLFTGVCNTLLTKYQDMQCVRNCEPGSGAKRATFHQPVLQTAQMFVGEMGCWLVVGIMALWKRYAINLSPRERGYEAVSTDDGQPNADADDVGASLMEATAAAPKFADQELESPVLTGWRVFLLALPAICDICGTTLMNAGLLMVVPSIYQMTRGALVLFVAIFSVAFLRRRLQPFQWISLVGVVLGVALVGLAGALYHENKGNAKDHLSPQAVLEMAPTSSALLSVIGVLLIAGAQIFTATQFVLEEWTLEKWAIDPIKVVGWEGIFGFFVTITIMAILHLYIGATNAGRYGPFDMAEGWKQVTTNRNLGISSILIMISIGGFNFFGLSVTRTVSATSRSTIDTCRTLFIWLVSLCLRWETFKWLQVVGFAILVYFTFLFNGLVEPPFRCLKNQEVVEELLPEEPIEHQ